MSGSGHEPTSAVLDMWSEVGIGTKPTSAVLDMWSEVGIGTRTNISSVRYVVRSRNQDTNQHQQC